MRELDTQYTMDRDYMWRCNYALPDGTIIARSPQADFTLRDAKTAARRLSLNREA